MLEIKNVTKIYKTKHGADVKALDNVSVSFEETGLVFLLGKSGSGKSTLLNVAGGLDEPTSGEVLVMGKSSKTFSGSDFDSYRNTYVGFVFQEYNVLNEFNVEENVALALELQGKTKETARVWEILKEVELDAFAKRKPNTLSGGQKQRIAIARALVKDPQIIMADEPTGALDSATGKQVFDTLKALSKTRLVLVVSHDREFAEIYGDRIIELKDGKIISDVQKKLTPPKQLSENVVQIGENTLSVKSGETLSEENIAQILSFLKESKGDVLISNGEKEINSFKQANRIHDSGASESFFDTDPTAIEVDKENRAHFIRSRLPLGKAMKIGASGLKLKPFRLILTIFLTVVAFIMFGLSSTLMLYNEQNVLVQSFVESDLEFINLSKLYESRETTFYDGDGSSYSYNAFHSAYFTPEEIKTLGGEKALGAYTVKVRMKNVSENDQTTLFERHFNIGKAIVTDKEHFLKEKLVAGQMPEGANEVCVSEFFAECLQKLDFYLINENGNTAGERIEISSAQQLVGKKLAFDNGNVFTVSGVFESGQIPSKFDALKKKETDYDFLLEMQLDSFLSEGLHDCMLVSPAFLTQNESCLNTSNQDYDKEIFHYSDSSYSFAVYAKGEETNAVYSTSEFASYNKNFPVSVSFFAGDKTTLAENEIIVPFFLFCDYEWSEKTSEKEWEKYNAFLEQANILREGMIYDSLTNVYRPATEEQKQSARTLVNEYLKELSPTVTMHDEKASDGTQPIRTLSIVGYYEGYYGGIVCSEEVFETLPISYKHISETKYEKEADAVYSTLLIPYDGTAQSFLTVYAKTNSINEQTDVTYRLGNSLYSEVDSVSSIIDVLSTVFLWVGIALALFASLMLFNFITLSITNKKKEIGILRAVGARGTDVFKIFFSESGIIVGICALLALVGTSFLTVFINGILRAELGFMVQLFVFGPIPMALMLAIALFVALISTFLPVFFAARKKPVESIRAL